MKIRIKNGAFSVPNNTKQSQEFNQWLKENAGKLVEVETDYLFNDQYNTEKFRVFDSHITEVVNDARVNKGKCSYCGAMHERANETETKYCTKREECKKYGIKWFTPENTYFLRYPKGAPVANSNLTPQIIGSYKFEYNEWRQAYELRNNRKRLIFRYSPDSKKPFILLDSIGNKQVKHLDVPEKVQFKVVELLNELIK